MKGALMSNRIPQRCLGYVRTATEAQATCHNLVQRQEERLRDYAEQQGMTYVGTTIVEGGKEPPATAAAAELVQRKNGQNDFDVLLIVSRDRLSRNWGEATHAVLALEDAGVLVVALDDAGVPQAAASASSDLR